MRQLTYVILTLAIGLISCSAIGKKVEFYNSGRISGGNYTTVDKYPFVVVMGYGWTGCTGSIIDLDWILTACHCVAYAYDRKDLSDPLTYYSMDGFKVVAGASHWAGKEDSRKELKVDRFVAHPKCLRNTNDVGVIRLKIPLTPFWPDPRIQPLKLFSHNKEAALAELRRLQEANTKCVRLGYGLEANDPMNKPSPQVKAGEGWLLTNKQCYEQICKAKGYACTEEQFDEFKWFCVRSNSSQQCKGDSGGPVICNGYLWGVISSGDAKCKEGRYDVLQLATRIDAILEMFHKDEEKGPTQPLNWSSWDRRSMAHRTRSRE